MGKFLRLVAGHFPRMRPGMAALGGKLRRCPVIGPLAAGYELGRNALWSDSRCRAGSLGSAADQTRGLQNLMRQKRFLAGSGWRRVGRDLRLNAATLDAYASAFENPHMQEAAPLRDVRERSQIRRTSPAAVV